jgi:hypothetical protein
MVKTGPRIIISLDLSLLLSNIVVVIAQAITREKAILGAPKWLIPGAFWFVGDLHAGGNAYGWRILSFAGDNFFYR